MYRIKRTSSFVLLVVAWLFLVAASLVFITAILYAFYKYKMAYEPTFDFGGKELIESLSFLGGILVATFTPIALLLGISQLKHGDNSRKATSYLEMNKRFSDNVISYSRAHLWLLSQKYPSEKIGTENLSQYVDRVLRGYRAHMMNDLICSATGRTQYGKSLAFLLYLEEIGVLVSQGYLEKEDCFEFIGGNIIFAEDLLRDHIIYLRRDNPYTFAHALSLMEEARKYRKYQKKYNKCPYKIP